MTSWAEILKANKGLHARDSFSELWGLKLKAARAEFPDYTITGNLPLSFNARVAGALKNYRIYGTSAGSGTPTESGEPAGYKIPISLESGVTENLFDVSNILANKYITTTDVMGNSFVSSVSNYCCVYGLRQVTLSFSGSLQNESPRSYCFYDSSKTLLETGDQYKVTNTTTTFAVPSGAVYMRFTFDNGMADVMLVPGSTAPDHYIPHRYESNYDLFIGSTKLGAEEYVDYQEQKRVKEVVKNASLSFDANTTSTKNVWNGVIPAKGKFIMSYMQEQTLISNSRNTPVIHLSNGTYIYKSANSNNQLEAGRYSWVVDLDYDDVNIDSLLYWVSNANTNLIISDINFLKPTDPPVPLPAIQAYQGENTLSSTETVGEVSITGKITKMA